MYLAKAYITKFVIIVFAFQILNLSVCGGEGNDVQYTAGARPIGELNQIDCMVEFVSEIILHFENAIKENGCHNSSESHNLLVKPHLSIKLFPHSFVVELPKLNTAPLYTVATKEAIHSLFYDEVIPHPPNFLLG